MNWGRPEFLKLLWLLPLVIIVLIAVERRWWARIRMIPYLRNRSLLPGVPSRILSAIRICLATISAGLLLASLAQPRWGFDWSEVRYSGIDIVVAIDVSKSMDAEDSAPSRLKIAKRKLTDLLQMLRGDRIGIVAFAGAAFVQCPLTVDYQAVRIFVDLLDSDLIPVGGSSLAEAVQLSVRSLTDGGTDNSKSKAIILMSDGEDFGAEMAEAIKLAESNRISIFTLGIGTETGAPIPMEGGGFKKDENGNMVLTRLQTESLKKLAESTGGVYAAATIGDEDLNKIYVEPLRGKGQIGATAEREKIYHERFQWLLFGALLLMLLEWLIPPLIRRKDSKELNSRSQSIAIILIFLGMNLAGSFTTEALAEDDSDAGSRSETTVPTPGLEVEAFNQGVGQYRSGDFKGAEDKFKAAAQSSDPGLRAKALYNLGSARAQQGRFKESAAALDEALKLDPDNQRIKENLEFVRQQKEEQPPEQQKQDQEKSQESDQEDSDKDQNKQQEDSDQKQPDQQNPSQQPQPESSQQQSSSGEKGNKDQQENSGGQPSPQASPQADSGKTGEQKDSSEANQTAGASNSPQPASSEAPTLASSPGPSSGTQSGEPVQVQPGQISPQQAEQLLRSVDDKISKYLYRPEGTPKNPPKQGNKDW
jgi:Ca-activated chloride channel family protein